MVFSVGIARAGEISWRRQEKGEGRRGTTDEPGVYPLAALCADRGDEPTTRKIPAPPGLCSGGRPRRRRARPYCRYALLAASGGSRTPERNAGCFHLRKPCSKPEEWHARLWQR